MEEMKTDDPVVEDKNEPVPAPEEGAGKAPEEGGSEEKHEQPVQNFWDSFEDEDLKQNGSVRKFKTVEAMAKGYVGLQRKLGERVATKLPDNATPEQVAAWRSMKRGGVEKEADYGFMPEEELEGFDASKMSKALFDAGADKDLYNSVMKSVYGMEKERRMLERKVREDGEAALREEWNEDYELNMKAVRMFVKDHFPEVYKGLDSTDAFRIPSIAKMFKQLNELTADGEIQIKKAAQESYEERLRNIEKSAAFNNEWDPGYKAARKAWRDLIAEKASKGR